MQHLIQLVISYLYSIVYDKKIEYKEQYAILEKGGKTTMSLMHTDCYNALIDDGWTIQSINETTPMTKHKTTVKKISYKKKKTAIIKQI